MLEAVKRYPVPQPQTRNGPFISPCNGAGLPGPPDNIIYVDILMHSQVSWSAGGCRLFEPRKTDRLYSIVNERQHNNNMFIPKLEVTICLLEQRE